MGSNKITAIPQRSLGAICRWLWRVMRGVRLRVAAVCLLGLCRVAVSLTFIWVSKELIDAATSQTSQESSLWWLSVALAACLLTELIFAQSAAYIREIAKQRLANKLRRDIYAELLCGDLYSDKRHSGDILNRLTVDVGSVVDSIAGNMPQIVVMIVELAAAFWLLCVMNSLLALCALIITPLFILAGKAYVKRMRRVNAAIRDGESRIHLNLQEGLQHRIVVQTLECDEELTGRLESLQCDLFENVLFRTRVSTFSRLLTRIGFIIGYLVAFIWSVFALHSGAITYGIMVAFLQLVARIQAPVSQLTSLLPSLVGTATAVERLMELSNPGDVCGDNSDSDSSDAQAGSAAGIRFYDVSFTYPDGDKMVIDHFSCDFRPGSKTVIMGETGVGKSTLTKLMLALVKSQKGEVCVYGNGFCIPVSEETRRFMTYVPQGNSLLQGTVRENLLLANPEATERQMLDALHVAMADFVVNLPDGLDSMCGELGIGLSEGECQRIAIARALLHDSPIMILDEFNSSLDRDTASQLLRRLLDARRDATIIFISHRSEVAELCDSVLRL